MAAMMREVGGFLVTHFTDLQSYSRCNSADMQNERGRKDEHMYLHCIAQSLSKCVSRAAMMREMVGFLVTHFVQTCRVTVAVRV